MSGRNRGSVLIVVLWVCALVMWVAFLTNADQRLRVDEEVLALDRSRGLYLAVGGAYEALARIAWQSTTEEDSMGESKEEANRIWRPDGKVRTVKYPVGEAGVSIIPLSEMVNVNTVKGESLARVLQSAGLTMDEARDLAEVVEDFRDKDDEDRDNGAEEKEYEEMGLWYPPLDSELVTVDQLLLVPGITYEMFYEGRKRKTDEEFFDQEPVEDAPLFNVLTAFGGSSAYSDNKTSGGFLEDDEEDEDETKPVFKSGEVYRIISTGKSSKRGAAVRLWIVAAKASSKRGYNVLFRKVM